MQSNMLLEQPLLHPPAPTGISASVSPWTVLKAATLKDLRIEKRYVADLIGGLVELAMRVLFFFVLAQVINLAAVETLGRSLTGSDLFVYFQGALMLFVFNNTALGAPLRAVNRDLYNGTLEFLYTNPAPRYAYYVGAVLSHVIISQVIFIPLYLLLVLHAAAPAWNMLMVLAVCLTLFITLIPLGVMMGMMGVLWRQVAAVAGALHLALEFITGAFLPLSALPPFVQWVAYTLPFTWTYDLIRYYSFNGDWNTILPVWQEWTILFTFALVYILISRVLLQKVEKIAKRQGLHLI